MRKISISLLLSVATLGTASANENLSLKRITEFWNDEAFDQAKVQMVHFLKEYPESDYCDHVNAMLGDLYLKEKAFNEAIATYEEISNHDLREKVESNYLQALFETENYSAILQKATRKSAQPKVNYLTAESCFHLGRKAENPEAQKSLYIRAAACYETLQESEYAIPSLWPLAEIYKFLGETEKASTLYLKLAETHPVDKENFLFQVAYLQAQFDKKLALKTFQEVYEIGKTHVKNAAYNLLMLQFETKEYAEFVNTYTRIEKNIPSEKKDSLLFLYGESLFRTEQLELAIPVLEKCKGKSALLLLAACAEKTENVTLLEKITKELTSTFPKDTDTAKAHLLCAHLHSKEGNNLKAQNHIKHVLNKFPDYPEREKLQFDYALTLYHNALWSQSREVFQNFLKDHPESTFKVEAWRHLLNCTLKEGERELFTTYLAEALENPTVFQGEEEQRHKILLIKLLFEQGKLEATLTHLESYLNTYPEAADGHYIAALYHEDNPSLFVSHAEKTLQLDPEFSDNQRLHLQLYNHYIQSAETQNQAADHLFSCASVNQNALKEENLRWLAGYYFNQKEDVGAKKRALALYEKLSAKKIEPTNEKEILRYAELLEVEDSHEKRQELLERLTTAQQAEANLPWKFTRHALFELAKTYKVQANYEKALEAFDTLIRTSTHMPSYFSRAAILERARLQYQLLTEEERTESNSAMQLILTSLKDLQLRKKLHSEPLHLEAALDYAHIMTILSKEENKKERAIFLLKRIKQDFTERNDMNAKDYQSQRTVLPDQALLLDSYLIYIDAEISRHQGKNKRAEKLLNKLEKDAHPSLQQRIITSRKALYDAG